MVVDTNKCRLKDVADRFGLPVSCEISNAFKTNPDWVFISVPHFEIKEIIRQAFLNNCNILVEKPLGRSLSECSEIIKFKKAKNYFYVGFNYRFFSGVNMLINDVKNKKFGKLISVNMILGHGNSPGMENSWKLDPVKCGGGSLIDPGIHLIDLAHIISESDEFKIIGVKTWSGFWNTGIEEEAHLIMTNSYGTIFNIQSSLNRWKSKLYIEVNGTDGYGIVEGRDRSYGPQSYIRGARWGWKSSISQKDSEEYILCDDDHNSFFKETVLVLGMEKKLNINSFLGVNPCTYLEAEKNMNTLEKIRLNVKV